MGLCGFLINSKSWENLFNLNWNQFYLVIMIYEVSKNQNYLTSQSARSEDYICFALGINPKEERGCSL